MRLIYTDYSEETADFATFSAATPHPVEDTWTISRPSETP